MQCVYNEHTERVRSRVYQAAVGGKRAHVDDKVINVTKINASIQARESDIWNVYIIMKDGAVQCRRSYIHRHSF